MKATVELLQHEGLRDRVFVIIGGLVDDRVARYVEADAWVRDAAQAIPICSRVLGSPPVQIFSLGLRANLLPGESVTACAVAPLGRYNRPFRRELVR